MDRRDFLKTAGVAGATALTAGKATATELPDDHDPFGILVDTTMCAGCRNCELVCAETNGLPVPDIDDETVFAAVRSPSDDQLTVVNRFDTDAGEVFVKRQCMHCIQPACASACLTKAMLKTEDGPVIWRGEKCMGCRFCMVSCPFDMPKFQYHSANPEIRKCRMCWERLQEGGLPACVENCPGEALMFGRRSELLAESRRRIYDDPDGYNHQVYGEHEVGGTGWLYLASVPFEQIGLRTDLGDRPYPELTKDFLYGVPVVLTLWPALLLGLAQATRHNGGADEIED